MFGRRALPWGLGGQGGGTVQLAGSYRQRRDDPSRERWPMGRNGVHLTDHTGNILGEERCGDTAAVGSVQNQVPGRIHLCSPKFGFRRGPYWQGADAQLSPTLGKKLLTVEASRQKQEALLGGKGQLSRRESSNKPPLQPPWPQRVLLH